MEYPKPSAYTPLSRRFASERERELEETRHLYAWVKAHQDAFTETKRSLGQRIYDDCFSHLDDDIAEALSKTMYDLLDAERSIWELPPPTLERMNLKEFVDYRNLLHAKEYFFTNQAALLELLHEGLVRGLYGVVADLPVTRSPSPFTIPLIYALPEPGLLVEKTYGTFANTKFYDRGLFRELTDRLHGNVFVASGIRPDDTTSTKLLKYAGQSTLPLDAIVDQYLGGTSFQKLFKTPVPLKLTHEDRFGHMHIVGGTGAGKTTLIENLILHDLASPDPPALVIVDPHGDLIDKLIHADIGIEDRLIYINPRDTRHPPALNVFAMNQERMAGYDEATREQVSAGVIQTFEYLFSGLFALDLSGKQSVFFRYVTRLMLSLPEAGVTEGGKLVRRNATIHDMLALIQDATPYLHAIHALPPIQRDFFIHDVLDPKNTTFKQTKEQIRYRLQAIIESPTMARLFMTPETKIDLFKEINRGAIILVDTAKDFLKDGSSTFGRIFISLTLQAVLERAAIPAHQRKPTFLIVDEAASYFDSNIDDLLTDARKYHCGCVFAHQYLDQASHSLRASLAANTSIKFASGLSAGDARSLAPEMRTTPDFILNQPRLQFAAHIKNVTPQAVSIPIERRERLPQLSAAAFDRLIERNRARVSLSQVLAAPEPPVFPGEPVENPPKKAW